MKTVIIGILQLLSIPLLIFGFLCLITANISMPSCSPTYEPMTEEDKQRYSRQQQAQERHAKELQQGWRYREIDGCEYIEVDSDHFNRKGYSLTHKGNCKNHTNP